MATFRKCKSCGALITFGTTKNGKLMPLNVNGEPHWATCNNPSSHRKKKPVKREGLPGINFDTDLKCTHMEFECQHMAQRMTKNGLKCLDCGKMYSEYTLEWE